MRKIEYACGAAGLFIRHLHTESFDRGMIATFGNSFQVEQGFTSTESSLHSALARVSRSVKNEGTRLYTSIYDVIRVFWDGARNSNAADKRRPWLLTVITDGKENSDRSDSYHNNPMGIGRYIADHFNHEPSNFMFLLGVGSNQDIDVNALATVAAYGGIPAIPVQAFPLLEYTFLQIALDVSTQLVGQRVNIGNLTWERVAQIRQISQTALDYAFLIDRSGTMNDSGD